MDNDDGFVEDYVDDKELKISPRKDKCPEYCSMFKCSILSKTGTCREECGKLDLTKSLICEICEEDCSKERKMILLDTKYFDHMRTVKTDNTSKNLEDIKTEFKFLEIRLQETRDEFHKLPSWQFWAGGDLKSKSGKIRHEMEIYKKIMDKLGIQYDETIEV